MADRKRKKTNDSGLGISISPQDVADPPRRVRQDSGGVMSLSPSGGRGRVFTLSRQRGDRSVDRFNRADTSRQGQLDDTTSAVISGSETEIKPLHGFGALNTLFQKSNILRQCVDAMVVNIAGFGKRVVPFDEKVPMDEAEKLILKSWIDQANADRSLRQEDRKQIFEFEKYGLRYYEVVRNKFKQPTILRHTAVAPIRALARQGRAIKVTREVNRGGSRTKVVEYKRFRKYIQRIGASVVYFKEFGDPRSMNYRTGKYQTPSSGRVSEKDQATELLHNKQDSEDVYGLPRWIAMVPAILGSRESEEFNVRYFEDNMIPAAIITVSGGRLTSDSFKEVRDTIEAGGIGKQNMLMLLEAIPETGGIEEKGVAQLKIERLSDERPSDGLFKEYDQANMAKIMSCFRLPPVIIGMSQDVTFATANVSAFVAEMQVFQPQRMYHDDWFNSGFVNHEAGLNLKTVKIESKGPPLTTPGEVVKALVSANTMGAMTPRHAIDLINELMQVSIPQHPEPNTDGWMEWMDQPLQLSLRLAAQNPDPDANESHEESGSKDADIDNAEEGNVGDVGSRRNLN